MGEVQQDIVTQTISFASWQAPLGMASPQGRMEMLTEIPQSSRMSLLRAYVRMSAHHLFFHQYFLKLSYALTSVFLPEQSD